MAAGGWGGARLAFVLTLVLIVDPSACLCTDLSLTFTMQGPRRAHSTWRRGAQHRQGLPLLMDLRGVAGAAWSCGAGSNDATVVLGVIAWC